jgi:hypothetical protein
MDLSRWQKIGLTLGLSLGVGLLLYAMRLAEHAKLRLCREPGNGILALFLIIGWAWVLGFYLGERTGYGTGLHRGYTQGVQVSYHYANEPARGGEEDN